MFKPEDLIEPLDFLILGELPEVGTMVLGLYPDGRSSQDLAEGLLQHKLTNGEVGRRLSSLRGFGLVLGTKAPGSQGRAMYQATTLGKKTYEDWKASHVDQ